MNPDLSSLLRRMSNHNHKVTFRFPSHFIHVRFNPIRAKDQRRKDLIEFFRTEVLLPAARFAYRAMQPEYAGEDNLPSRIWKRARGMCLNACSNLDVMLDDGFVTLTFTVVTHTMVEERDLRKMLDAIENHIGMEQVIHSENKKLRKEHSTVFDKYEDWRNGAYSDIQKAILNATFFQTPDEGVYTIQSTYI